MRTTSKISSQYQVSIPRELAEKAGLEPGMKVSFTLDGRNRKGLYIQNEIEKIDSLRGSAREQVIKYAPDKLGLTDDELNSGIDNAKRDIEDEQKQR